MQWPSSQLPNFEQARAVPDRSIEHPPDRITAPLRDPRSDAKQKHQEELRQQMEMDKMRKVYDRDENIAPGETHFGPQEDRHVTQVLLNRKREMQNHLYTELQNQISENQQVNKNRMQMEKLRDSVNMGAVN